MTNTLRQSYDSFRVLQALANLSLEEKLLLVGAIYCASRKASPETLRTLVRRSVQKPSENFTNAVNEFCCLEPSELRDVVKALPSLIH